MRILLAALLLFAPAAFAEDCLTLDQVSQNVGKNVCVTAKVLKVYEARSGHTYFDFCEDFRDCPFTAVVFRGDKKNVGDLKQYEGKEIKIYGELKDYKGKPEIIISDRRQFSGFVSKRSRGRDGSDADRGRPEFPSHHRIGHPARTR
jgi:hypothetical protein